MISLNTQKSPGFYVKQHQVKGDVHYNLRRRNSDGLDIHVAHITGITEGTLRDLVFLLNHNRNTPVEDWIER